MKKILYLLSITLIISVLFSSCATIVGGSSYNAYVSVDDHTDAKIYYNGVKIGTGTGVVTIPRKETKLLSFKVSKAGCPEETINFTDRKFRGWAFAGSLFFFSYYYIPIGNIVDFASGAYYKPNHHNPMVRKGDYNNYYYTLSYECDTPSNTVVPGDAPSNPVVKTKSDKLIELKELYDKGMITEEEYKVSRQEILNK